MTNTFKRRIYRISLASATSFLIGFLLYDLVDVGIATSQFYWPCFMLVFAGIILSFKALDTWSSWMEDNSEDTNVGGNVRNAYPITFYIQAAIMTLIVIFLLTFTATRNRPTIEEVAVSNLCLFVAGGCTLMGWLSSGLE